MIETPTIADALELSQWFKVYPLAKHSVVPPKDSNGHLMATQEHNKIVDFFTELAPEGNIGASLIDTDYFVVDVDRKHEGEDGLSSLTKIDRMKEGFGNPVTVATKSGGFHLYYKTSEKIENKIGFLEHVDILKNGVIMPPSVATNSHGELGEYTLGESSFNDITEPPEWLLNAILQDQRQSGTEGSISTNYKPSGRKKWTAIMLEELAEGCEKGGRNDWLTSQLGRMFYLGTDAEVIYEYAGIINENFVSPPLNDKEVNKIFGSVLKQESRKWADK